MSDVLDQVAAEWRPEPILLVRTITPGPVAAFADLLDEEIDWRLETGVPPLWHWFAFSVSYPQRILGEDGHPRESRFVPPFRDRRRMMAGGRLWQLSPFRLGRRYERRSELADMTVKTGRTGKMLLTTVRHTFADDNNSTVAVEEEDVVYRQQPAGVARRLPAELKPGQPWHESLGTEGAASFHTDSRLLFRFSALTYNAHRIHYDASYAAGVEGYPGLVVHGPLLALQMLELLRRAGRSPREFRYRLSRPMFCGEPIIATWDDRDLRIGVANAAETAATATLTFG